MQFCFCKHLLGFKYKQIYSKYMKYGFQPSTNLLLQQLLDLLGEDPGLRLLHAVLRVRHQVVVAAARVVVAAVLRRDVSKYFPD